MENYFNQSVHTGFDMVEYVDDTHNIYPSQHPHFPHLHSDRMPSLTDVLLDDASADHGCLPFFSPYDESIVDTLIRSQFLLDSYSYSPIADQNIASWGLHQESEPYNPSLLGLNESNETSTFLHIHDEKNSAFDKWKPSPCPRSLPSKGRQSIPKRCFRLLNYISSHRIRGAEAFNTNVSMRGDVEINVRRNHDKLAIHHVIAERRRREDMEELFSTLRGLLPIKTKKGRPTVLLETIDYVITLKRRVEELEKRNEELERLTTADHILKTKSYSVGHENNSSML